MNLALDQSFSSPVDPHLFEGVVEMLETGVREGVFPGAVLLVGKDGNEIFRAVVGKRSLKLQGEQESAPMEINTVFDIASLTAVLTTATIYMRILELKMVALEDRVSRYVQGFSVFGKSEITLADLMLHCSGLAHWMPYYEEILRQHAGGRIGMMASRGARDYIINSITRAQLKYSVRSRQQYSDLGLILLGHIIEVITGMSLERAAQHYVFQPLGLRNTSFIDLSMMKRRGIQPVTDLIAPTEECSWRKRVLCGEVHDDNAWAMGGIAGHSGVFSTGPDLHQFSAEMIRCYRGQSEFLKSDTLRTFWHAHLPSPTETFQLFWDTPGKHNNMSDSTFSPYAVGQNGFSGCSIWIEPHQGFDIVLMTNRIHPSRSNRKIRTYRPKLHDAVLGVLRDL
ncbi:MAG: serine hydrolase [Bdellovibrionales bacterium]|nr:serine hydrolase [Bdellovibrionales bacterium]